MDWREAMAAFYRDADQEIAVEAGRTGTVCDGCGTCCRFDVVDHLLYASELERRYLLLMADPVVSPDAGAELLAKGLRCPFQSGGKCLAREGRVLGCRLHFCRWPVPAEAEDLAERWHRRLKTLHESLNIPWHYRLLLPLPPSDQTR